MINIIFKNKFLNFNQGGRIYKNLNKLFSNGVNSGNNSQEKINEKNSDFFFKIEKEAKLIKLDNSLIENSKDSKSIPLVENEEYRKLYKNFSVYFDEKLMEEYDKIYHNEKLGNKEYKYGILAKNELPFTELIVKEEENVNLPKTATENLFDLLELDKDSSYESMLLKFQGQFSNGKLIF
jgi:hypothetical protein